MKPKPAEFSLKQKDGQTNEPANLHEPTAPPCGHKREAKGEPAWSNWHRCYCICAMKKHSSRGSNMGCYCLLMFNKYKIKQSLNSNTEKLKFGLNQNNLKANSKFHIPCSVIIFWNPWSRLLPITDFQNLRGGTPSPKVTLFLLPQPQRTKQHEGEATPRDRPPPSI